MAIKSAALLLALLSSASALLISPEPVTHNQAVMFCASQQSRLLDVTSANKQHVIGELAGVSAWVGSWDYNYYSGKCMQMINEHIGEVDCNEKAFALCIDRPILKSTREVQDVQEVQVEENVEGDKLGARPSRRHHKPCAKPCERVEVCERDCGYEYVYLTQTVSRVYTSIDLTTVYTSTITEPNFTATVAAYTVITPSLTD